MLHIPPLGIRGGEVGLRKEMFSVGRNERYGGTGSWSTKGEGFSELHDDKFFLVNTYFL
jgi:hypothetical protein